MEDDLEDFLAEVDYVSSEIERMVKDPTSETSSERDKRLSLEAKRQKQSEAKRKREEEELRRGRPGHGEKFDTYSHYCPRCIREFAAFSPVCPHCNETTWTAEERKRDLIGKVEKLKEERGVAREKRAKWENWKKTEAILYRKTATNYRKWDYFEPEEEEELPFVPPEDPAFKEMERDMEQRKIQRLADFKRAEELKDRGNSLFRQGNFQQALEKYTEAQKIKRDHMVLYTNSALARLKLKDYEKALEDCNRVLEYCEVFEDGYRKSPDLCFKALTRRAQAQRGKGNASAAVDDLVQALALKEDPEAASLLARCRIESRVQPPSPEDSEVLTPVTDSQELLSTLSSESELLRFISMGGYQSLAHQVYLHFSLPALDVLSSLCSHSPDYIRLYPLTKRIKGDINAIIRLLRTILKPQIPTDFIYKILEIVSISTENAEIREELMEQSANSRKWSVSSLILDVFFALNGDLPENIRLCVTIISNLCLTVKSIAAARQPNPGDMREMVLFKWDLVKEKLNLVRVFPVVTSALFSLYCNLAVHPELREKLGAEENLILSIISDLQTTSKSDILESGLGLLINLTSGSSVLRHAEEVLSIPVRCFGFLRSTDTIDLRALTLVSRLMSAKAEIIPEVAGNTVIFEKIISTIGIETHFQQSVKILIMSCPQANFALNLPHNTLCEHIGRVLNEYIQSKCSVELAANAALLVCRVIDAETSLAGKYKELIQVLIEAVGEKTDVVRKNCALALGRLARNEENLEEIRERHGMEVLRSVSGFVLD